MRMTNWCVVSDELYHHGIKGQKWGVRRFQNPDGTRTAAGRKRDKANAADRENEKGMSQDARKKLRNAAIAVSAAAAVGVGIYVVHKYRTENCDKLIRKNTPIQHMSRSMEETLNKPFYASYLKQDNKVYAQNNLFGANWQSKMTLSSDKDLKVAGKRSAGKMFKEWIDSDQEAKERFGNTSYFSFNKNLNSPDVRDQKLFSRFYSFMGSKGYDAVHDWNDQYETKTKSPLIIFGSLGNISVSDIKKAANYKPPAIKKPEIPKVSIPRVEVPKVNINRTPISKIDIPKTTSYEDLVNKNRDLFELTLKSIGY